MVTGGASVRISAGLYLHQLGIPLPWQSRSSPKLGTIFTSALIGGKDVDGRQRPVVINLL